MGERPCKPRILLADDSPVLLERLKGFLERAGFEVVGSGADGDEAIQLAEALDPDVAILDLTMPRVNGLDAARGIRQRCPRTRVILLTAHTEEHLIFAALSAGVRGYVSKLDIAEDLIPAIKEVARGGSFLPCAGRSLVERYLPQAKSTGEGQATAPEATAP